MSVYIVRRAEFRQPNRPIYKVGGTDNPDPHKYIAKDARYRRCELVRMAQLPIPGSFRPVETAILTRFRQIFKPFPEDGSESFQVHDKRLMTKEFERIVDGFNETVVETEPAPVHAEPPALMSDEDPTNTDTPRTKQLPRPPPSSTSSSSHKRARSDSASDQADVGRVFVDVRRRSEAKKRIEKALQKIQSSLRIYDAVEAVKRLPLLERFEQGLFQDRRIANRPARSTVSDDEEHEQRTFKTAAQQLSDKRYNAKKKLQNYIDKLRQAIHEYDPACDAIGKRLLDELRDGVL